MRQIIYFSTAADVQDASVVAAVAAISDRHNLRDGVTGMLVAGGHRYLQVLEGEAAVVEATLARIRRDRRHVGVTLLIDRPVTRRSLAGWSVAFEGEPEFGEFSTLSQMIEVMRRQVTDRAVRAQIDCFARQFVVRPLPEPPSPWAEAARTSDQPSIAAISDALPPAAVVSTQVTRSVAKRAT